MNKKHLSKNLSSHKLIFLAVIIAVISAISVFGICANQANADSSANKVTKYTPHTETAQSLILTERATGWQKPTDSPVFKVGSISWNQERGIADGNHSASQVTIWTIPGEPNYALHFVCLDNSDGYKRTYELSANEPATLSNYIWYYEGKAITADESNPLVIDLSEKTEIQFDFEPRSYPETVNVFGSVVDENGNPIPGVEISVYPDEGGSADIPFPLEVMAVTDDYGKFRVENCKVGSVGVYVLVNKFGLSTGNYWFSKESTISGELDVNELFMRTANIMVYGKEHHISFQYTRLVEPVIGEPFTDSREFAYYSSYTNPEFSDIDGCTFTIGENGVLSYVDESEKGKVSVTIKLSCEDGYVFDKYVGNGVEYKTGDEYTIHVPKDGEPAIDIATYYKPAASEETQTAQTGDMTAYAVIALSAIAVIAGVVFVRRKNEIF